MRAPGGENQPVERARPTARHAKYTGIPVSTIASPGHVVCVLWRSSTTEIRAATTM